VKFLVHYAHKRERTPWKICLLGQTSYAFRWRLFKYYLKVAVWFSVLTDCGRPPRPSMLNLYTSRPPGFVQGARCCEIGWNVSAWKVPTKMSLCLDNWFLREMGLYNLDPLVYEITCCLIHCGWELKLWSSDYDLSGKQKPGLIWY